jgi:hypothetical protein
MLLALIAGQLRLAPVLVVTQDWFMLSSPSSAKLCHWPPRETGATGGESRASSDFGRGQEILSQGCTFGTLPSIFRRGPGSNMILQTWKIRQHWGRLLAEFVVIAIGVMAALAVDNWNDERKDRAAEKEYLNGIATDLRSTAEGLITAREAAAENQEALLLLISIARGGSPPPAESLVEALIRSTYLGLPRVSEITFRELVSTGSLRLIRDADFKRQLAEFYRGFEYISQWYPEYRRKEAATELLLRGLLPLQARLRMHEDGVARAAGEMDVPAVVEGIKSRADAVAALEDSVWTQHRVMLACDRLLIAVGDLQKLLNDSAL